VASHPTIKDVAREAGVHFTTVSLALRGLPPIPAATRDRIVAAAQRLGYQRNPVFDSLSAHRRRQREPAFNPRIVFVANQTPELYFRHAHNRRLFVGVQSEARAFGHEVEILFLERGHFTSASLERHLRAHGITGIVMAPFQPGRPALELPWEDFAVVKIDSRHLEPPVTLVASDQMQCARLAFRELRRCGYRRIGLAVGEEDEVGTDELYLSAWWLEHDGVPEHQRVPPLHFPLGLTSPDVVPLLRTWIREHRIDAVACNWATIRSMVRQAGFPCPAAIACCCLCLVQPTPSLAGVITNLDLVGRRAVALLAGLLRHERRGIPALATQTYVEGTWHDGPSAPARG
jgi:LacI family transcriptional regulator